MSEVHRATILVAGRVQGVGFRWWVRSRALELGLSGFARNLENGKVEIQAQGDPAAIDQFVALLREQPTTTRRPGAADPGFHVLTGRPRADLVGFVEL